MLMLGGASSPTLDINETKIKKLWLGLYVDFRNFSN